MPMETVMNQTHLSRRSALLAGGAMFGAAFLPRLAFAAGGRDPRLIVVILRGALDGLSAVPPLGDPDYAALRDGIALSLDGASPAHPLDNFFALHPALPVLARLYREKRASIVHAAATPYRSRSHFDGQDILESGSMDPAGRRSGWLNRVIAEIPAGAQPSAATRSKPQALGVGPTAPLILRGDAPVAGWAPVNFREADEDLTTRLLDLYAQRDPRLGESLAAGAWRRQARPRDDHAGASARRRRGHAFDCSGRGQARGGGGRPAYRCAGVQRLGHARRRRRGDRQAGESAGRPRWRFRRVRAKSRAALARHGHPRRHGIRTDRAGSTARPARTTARRPAPSCSAGR
jgi:uncharacterized protein (DUF1501 family)